jgi:hypothetical protein
LPGLAVGDQKVHAVGFAIELDQVDIQLGAEGAHDVFAEGEHRLGEHRPTLLGYEYQMCVEQPSAAIGRGCQWPSLRLWRADA